MVFHNLIYEKSVRNLSISIDKKSENTWIFRIIKNKNDTLFHCHVMQVGKTSCYVEIAYSSGSGNLRNLAVCKPLFLKLSFTTVLYKNSLTGKIKQIKLNKEENG